jgi:FkbM family methyltransferase
MKELAKRLLRSVAGGLPERAQAQVLQEFGDSGLFARLPEATQARVLEQLTAAMGPWRMLAQLVPRCRIDAIKVTGAYGTVQSAATDQVMLPIYAETGRWAQRTNNLLISFFAERGAGHYVDVGANIGLTTIPVAQNPLVRCLAIEPEPVNFANLSANVAQNCPHGNVELRRLALYSDRRTLKLELSTANLGDHRLRLAETAGRMKEETRATTEIEAVPLDELVREPATPLAVKIDVQGAEPFVFAGGPKTLASADLVILEWAPYLMARLGGNVEAVTDLLRDNFASISMADGEFGPPSAPEAAATATSRLLEMARRHADDPGASADVIARK